MTSSSQGPTMRMPSPKFSVRQMMIAVAIVACLLAFAARWLKLRRLSEDYLNRAYWCFNSKGTESLIKFRYLIRLSEKYRSASMVPWLPVAPDPPPPSTSWLTFGLDGMTVGKFGELDPPLKPGRYRYASYQDPGHQAMQAQLRAGGLPRCSYEGDGVRVSFTVRSCPRIGEFDLGDFQTSPIGRQEPD